MIETNPWKNEMWINVQEKCHLRCKDKKPCEYRNDCALKAGLHLSVKFSLIVLSTLIRSGVIK